MQSQVHCGRWRRGAEIDDSPSKCSVWLGELDLCMHLCAQPTAPPDPRPPSRSQPPLTPPLPVAQVSSVVNNIIASLNGGSSFGNETTTATATAPPAAEGGNEALGFSNNAANSPLAAALSGQTNQIIVSVTGLTTTS